MSLINQALKKAQRDRASNHMPPPPGSMPEADSGPAQGMKPNLLLGLIASIALLIGLVAGLLVVVLHKDPATVQPAITPTPTAAAVYAPQPAAPHVISTKAPKILEELRAAREAAEAQAAQAQKAALQPSQQIISWIESVKIAGLRISQTGRSKVLLNNKSYSIGETVHFGLGIKLLDIQEQRVFFVDANGKQYRKQM